MEAATWGIIDSKLESTIQSPIQQRMEWLLSPSPAVVARSCATASVTVAVIQRFIALRSPRLVIEGPHTEGVGCGPCPENTEVCGSESRPATMVRSDARGKMVPLMLVSMSADVPPVNGCVATGEAIPGPEVVVRGLPLGAGAPSTYLPDPVRSGPPMILFAVSLSVGGHTAAEVRPSYCPRAVWPRMVWGYPRVVSACSRLKGGRGGVPHAHVGTRGGAGGPPVVGAQMLAPMAPRFDVGSLSRLAPEWGQTGTGTVLGASTLVDQGDPRVGVPVAALVHPSNQWRVRWPPQAGVGAQSRAPMGLQAQVGRGFAVCGGTEV